MTTGRFGLSAGEWATTAAAAFVSTAAYLVSGSPYLARGVVGDLLGFVLLGAVALATGRRLRHEALVCLALIGAVLLAGPQWPLSVPDAVWWLLFLVGLASYVVLRRRVCD